MNTTDLIREWSMDGASEDVDGSFATLVDITARLSERESEDERELEPAPVPAPLLYKSADADDDDWRPLLGAVSTG
jgi:hypothetical protein